MGTTSNLDLDSFLNNLPKLHSFDSGKTWNTGGFKKFHLEHFYRIAKPIKNCKIIETGSGNSTILFLLSGVKEIISISPDTELWERIINYCKENEVEMSSLRKFVGKSEDIFPNLEVNHFEFDIGLIDGCHGWPNVFIDFFYIDRFLRKDGFLILDDIHLHSVRELAKFLSAEGDQFRCIVNLGKTLIFQKLNKESDFGEWNEQNYILLKTRETIELGHSFSFEVIQNPFSNQEKLWVRFLQKMLIFMVKVCFWVLVRVKNDSSKYYSR